MAILITVPSTSTLCTITICHCKIYPSSASTRHFSQACWGKEPGTGSSLALRQWNTSKSSTSLTSFTHTEQDKQDIPAAGCTGFLALANLKRRVRVGAERSGAAGGEGQEDVVESHKG